MPEIELFKDRKILICDDDKIVTDFLQRFLTKKGYTQIDIALTGEEALEKTGRGGYQLLFLDIRLPNMDGIQVLQRVKEIDKNIGVIMITGFPDIETAKKALEMGAYDYIVKPFDLAYLELVVLTKLLIDSK